MFYFTLILSMACIFLITIFAIQNSMIVSVNVFTWNVNTSLVLVILGSALLGFLMAFCLGLYTQFKLRLKLHKTSTQIKKLEQQLAQQPTLDTQQNNEKIKNPLP